MARKNAWMPVLLLALWISPLTTIAEAVPRMVFRHLTVDDGLAENFVTATLQDSQGFLWIATQNGLDRYDGYDLRHFSHQRGAESGLPSNYIYAMHGDRRGNIWLAVKDGGLSRLDPRTETFANFRFDPHDPHSLSSDAVRDFFIDHDGQIWVATTGSGLSVLDPTRRHADRYRHDPTIAGSLISDIVTAVAEDHQGRMWLGTDKGLDLWLPATHSFRHFTYAPDNSRSLSANSIASLYVDREGVLWVGTYLGGLNRFDGEAAGFTRYTANESDPAALSNPEVRAVLEDDGGRLWVGTAHGLDLLDRKTGKFVRFTSDRNDSSSLRDDYVVSLFQDRGGLLWVGTVNGGVRSWNPRSWLFGHVNPTWGGGAYPIAFADDTDGRLWVGTQGAGLFRYDPASGQGVPAERVFGRPGLLPDRRIMALLKSRTGDLWIGTMESGMVRLEPNGTLIRFQADPERPDDPHAIGAAGIMALNETSDGRIWAGTFRGGVAVIDPRTNRVQRVATDVEKHLSAPNPPATSIVEDHTGVVWVGTDGGGLLAFDLDGSFWPNGATRSRISTASAPIRSIRCMSMRRGASGWAATVAASTKCRDPRDRRGRCIFTITPRTGTCRTTPSTEFAATRAARCG